MDWVANYTLRNMRFPFGDNTIKDKNCFCVSKLDSLDLHSMPEIDVYFIIE